MGIGPIIVLGIILLFGVFMYFIVVRSNKKNKLLMDSLKEVDIPEKQIKEDEIKSNLSI
jgi:preprotein translocase subunit YajC